MKTPLTKEETKTICERIAEYDPAVNPWQVRFFWSDKIGSKNGILGMFQVPDRITLPLDMKLEILYGVMLDSTICHELYHCWQYREQGLARYAILNLFRCNEVGAKKEERRVDKILGLDALNS